MIRYRRAAAEDARLLSETRQKAWAATYRGIYPDEMIDNFDYPWHIARETKNLQNPNIHTYLVMDENQCMGYFTYWISATPIWRDYHVRLQSLYLLPALQGAGHGRRILNYVKNQCRKAGFDKLYLSCDPQNTSAMGFYLHMGGTVVAEVTSHGPAFEDSVELELQF